MSFRFAVSDPTSVDSLEISVGVCSGEQTLSHEASENELTLTMFVFLFKTTMVANLF